MNLFDDVPDTEPETLTAGDLWSWTKSDLSATYPPADYTLKYTIFYQSSTIKRYSFDAGVADDGHMVSVSSAITKTYTPGEYQYQAQIERNSDSEIITVGSGFIRVLPELSSSSNDARSHARKVLDSICAVIEKTATKEQESYSVAGRSLSRRSIDDLLTLKDRYQRIVDKEQAEIDRKNGKTGARVLVKMDA